MKMLLALLVFFAAFGLVSADGNAFAKGKELVESNISCDQLTEHQLEEIGEYIMEQMHPGAGHEAMHKMMGLEEGTAEEEGFHINLAKNIYCGTATSGGMMGGNMMNGMAQNMMGGNWQSTQSGMMTYYNQPNLFGWTLLGILLIVLLLGLIILVYLNIWGKIRNMKAERE